MRPLAKVAPGTMALDGDSPGPLGIIGLGLSHDPTCGMVTHPSSFNYPIRYETLRAPRLVERVLSGDEQLYDQIRALGRCLVEHGVAAVATSCGYFSVYQQRLAAELTVPVFTSPLLQIPTVLATLGPNQRLGIVWASVNELVQPALTGAGVQPGNERLVHVGMDGPGTFRDAILAGDTPLDSAALQDQVSGVCDRLLDQEQDVGALLLECGDVSAYANAVRARTRAPVYDYLTLLDWARAAIAGRSKSPSTAVTLAR